MRSFVMSLFVLAAGASLCLAQPAGTPAKPSTPAVAPAASALQTAAGKVKWLASADPAKGKRPQIVITDANGLDVTFVLMPSAAIKDKTGQLIPTDKLVAGQSVAVKYIVNKEGVKEALGISVE